MSNRTTGRHRAPSRLSEAGTTISRSAKTTAVVATSGGLLAAAVGPATASPQGIVDEVASVVTGATVHQGAAPAVSAVDLLGQSMPIMAEPTDLPAVAVAAPEEVDTDFGALGFTGVTPVVEEPEPEPVVETAAVEAPAAEAAAPAAETTSSTSERAESSASRTNEREAAPAVQAEPEPEPEPAPAPAPTAAPPSSGGGGVLGIAAQYTGIMYQYGGSTPAGFDCSGYTSFVFRQVGIELPRSAAGQQSYATPVSNPQPGDLVFWGYPAYHVGIYAGNGMVYDSGRPGIPTQLRPVFSGVSGYGRVL